MKKKNFLIAAKITLCHRDNFSLVRNIKEDTRNETPDIKKKSTLCQHRLHCCHRWGCYSEKEKDAVGIINISTIATEFFVRQADSGRACKPPIVVGPPRCPPYTSFSISQQKENGRFLSLRWTRPFERTLLSQSFPSP